MAGESNSEFTALVAVVALSPGIRCPCEALGALELVELCCAPAVSANEGGAVTAVFGSAETAGAPRLVVGALAPPRAFRACIAKALPAPWMSDGGAIGARVGQKRERMYNRFYKRMCRLLLYVH